MKRIFWIFLALHCVSVLAIDSSDFVLSVGSSTVTNGRASIDLELGKTDGIVGFQFDLQFDNSLLEFTASEFCTNSLEQLDDVIKSSGAITLCRHQNPPNDDFIRFVIFDFSMNGLSPGVLANLEFSARSGASGVSPVAPSACSMLVVDQNGNSRLLSPDEYEPGYITISDDPPVTHDPPRPIELDLSGPSGPAEAPFSWSYTTNNPIKMLEAGPEAVELMLPGEFPITVELTRFDAIDGYIERLDCSGDLVPDPGPEIERSFSWSGVGNGVQMNMLVERGEVSGEIIAQDRVFKMVGSEAQGFLLKELEPAPMAWREGLVPAEAIYDFEQSYSLVPNLDHLRLNLPEISLSLPGVGMQIATRDYFELRENGFLWRGKLKDRFESVIITASESRMYATIISKSGRFVVTPKTEEHVLSLPGEATATCGVDFRRPGGFSEPVNLNKHFTQVNSGEAASRSKTGQPVSIDVAFLVSNQACDELLGQSCDALELQPGGTELVLDEISLLAQSRMDVINTALANSEVNAELSIVHSGRLDYDDTGKAEQDWDNLRFDPDVQNLRDHVGADLVTMSIVATGFFGGFANIPRAIQIADTSSQAYSVNDLSVQIGFDIDAHEFGHNFGGEHNPEESSASPGDPPGLVSYPYAFGHYSDVGKGEFTTIMVVDRTRYCQGGSPPCFEPLLYSNADLTCSECNGFPVGIANVRENAKAFMLTAPMIAGYRDRPELIFASGFEG